MGTHADCVCTGNDSAESTAAALLESISEKFDDVALGTRIFSVNALEAMSTEMKALRGALSELKAKICQVCRSFAFKICVSDTSNIFSYFSSFLLLA